MLHDLKWLWLTREKPRTAKRWMIVWAKRIKCSLALFKLLLKPMWYRYKGAQIDRLVILGESKSEGHLELLSVGQESSLGRCKMALHQKIQIGKRVVINDDVTILTASHSLSDPLWSHKKKPVVIDDYAWIATGSIILPGVTIGRGAVVGAGSVVRENVQPFSVVAGNPAIQTGGSRSRNLKYSPVLFNAPFEAWVGPTPNISIDFEETA